MTDLQKQERTLELFQIPEGEKECPVRSILARTILTGNLKLGEIQVARDIIQRKDNLSPFAYIVIAAMFLSLRSGNTFMKLEDGPKLLSDAGYWEGDVDSEEMLPNEQFSKKIERLWNKQAGDVAKNLAGDVVVCNDDDEWYFQRNFHTIARISEKFHQRILSAAEDEKPLTKKELNQAIAFQKFELNADQTVAVQRAVGNRFTVITGGPGTGKTTIVCAILRALLARRDLVAEDIALAAPTGRAAKRMSEALKRQCEQAKDLDEETKEEMLGLEGSTIHALLGGYAPNWYRTADNPLSCKLVVVDESSMVDVELMDALLSALPEDCRLILLGDKDQLPSVGAGALLGDLVGDHEVVAKLEQSQRFTGKLRDCAKEINGGKCDTLKLPGNRLPKPSQKWIDAIRSDIVAKNNCFWYEIKEGTTLKHLRTLLCDWAEFYGLLAGGDLVLKAEDFRENDPALTQGVLSDAAKNLFKLLDRSRILTMVRRGPYGVLGVNDLILRLRCGGHMPNNPLSLPGVPVIVTANTKERDLYNGDIGITVKGKDGMVCLFPRGEKVVSCPITLLPEHEPAYAITVHKSQGSEFENVLVVLPDDDNHPLLSRPILYTGVTRAKRCAVILGTEAALDHALATTITRHTGVRL